MNSDSVSSSASSGMAKFSSMYGPSVATSYISSPVPPVKCSSHAQGCVYSLSGKIGHQGCLVRVAQRTQWEAPRSDRNDVSQQARTSPNLRSLPYRKCHQVRFLALEQDTEILMQILQSQIKPASLER